MLQKNRIFNDFTQIFRKNYFLLGYSEKINNAIFTPQIRTVGE